MFCPDSIVWGNVGTWVGAIGTFLAVAIALWVALSESIRRRKQERRKQAEQIAGWVRFSSATSKSVVEVVEGVRRETGRTVTSYTADLGVINNSGGVVYNVVLVLSNKDGPDDSVDVLVGTLGPGRWALDAIKIPERLTGERLELDIYFSDQEEVKWRRQPNGRLSEVDHQRQSPDGPNRRWKTFPEPLSAKEM